MATSTPTLDSVLQLADAMARLSVKIFLFLDENPAHPAFERLKNLERNLDDKVNELTGTAIKLLGEEADKALAQLQKISESANAFVKKVDDAKKFIQVAVSLLGVAGAVLMGDAQAVLTSVAGLKDVVQASKA